jgi:hypothetical protein
MCYVVAMEFKLRLKICVVYPAFEVKQLEENFEVKQFFDAAYSVLMLVSEVCYVTLMKHKLLYEIADQSAPQHQGSTTGNSYFHISLF